MKTEVIASVNGLPVRANNEGGKLLLLESLCVIINADYEEEKERILKMSIHPSHISCKEDGSEMMLSVKYFPVWWFSISGVGEEKKKEQMEVYERIHKIYYEFQAKRIEQDAIEIKLLEEIARLTESKGVITKDINEKRKQLELIRLERLQKEPGLFDEDLQTNDVN